LLQPVVARDEQLLDALTRLISTKIFHPELLGIKPKPMKTSAASITNLEHAIRVLIVDDEAPFTRMVQALLEVEQGIEVVGTAQDGKQAVELAHDLEPDVIVMDISMPIMNGLDATREIRAQDPTASVLILTGGSNVVEIDEARTIGAAGYLTKDRIAGELVAEIRSLGAE
jgi:DNA-binding NarL/FixJ family response regulator